MSIVSIARPRSRRLSGRPNSKREKTFGHGRPRGLDREAKVRIMIHARALSKRTEKGRHYGMITAKALDVLEALLWCFHNARSGLCFPSYETIAKRARCARSTVAEAIKALEQAGILSWVNRLVRLKEPRQDIFGHWRMQARVIRTSNAYHFYDPGTKTTDFAGKFSKSEFPSKTTNQESHSSFTIATPLKFDPNNPLDQALKRLAAAIGI